ncbi:MAG: YihY/virulence factor BrkB family protein [Chitinophagaceae bacterium]|nr:YihY/virulence factor BrkB family protein [Chitinophagaceae bacterium]
MTKLESILLRTTVVRFAIAWSKKIILPGFDQVPLYDVVIFFISQMNKVGLNDRAAAVSFNFLMAIPAATIFLCTLIPYMPISREITVELLDLTRTIAPNENTYQAVSRFLNDFLNTPRSGLLSVGFIIAVYYASNSVLAMMRSFNRSFMQVKRRGIVRERWTAIKLTTALILLIMATITLLVTQGELFRYLMKLLNIQNPVIRWLIFSIRGVIMVLLVLYSIGIIYKYAPAIPKRWKLASPGAILATLLVILSTFILSFWATHFSSYNKIYGSIGTLMLLMFLVYVNSLILLIGYELNVSIHSLKAIAEEREKTETPA